MLAELTLAGALSFGGATVLAACEPPEPHVCSGIMDRRLAVDKGLMTCLAGEGHMQAYGICTNPSDGTNRYGNVAYKGWWETRESSYMTCTTEFPFLASLHVLTWP